MCDSVNLVSGPYCFDSPIVTATRYTHSSPVYFLPMLSSLPSDTIFSGVRHRHITVWKCPWFRMRRCRICRLKEELLSLGHLASRYYRSSQFYGDTLKIKCKTLVSFQLSWREKSPLQLKMLMQTCSKICGITATLGFVSSREKIVVILGTVGIQQKIWKIQSIDGKSDFGQHFTSFCSRLVKCVRSSSETLYENDNSASCK